MTVLDRLCSCTPLFKMTDIGLIGTSGIGAGGSNEIAIGYRMAELVIT